MDLEQQPWPKLYQAAVLAVDQDRWSAAELLLNQCLRQNSMHASAHHLLGKVLFRQKRLEEALEAQLRSCELDPALGWNWYAAGEILIKLLRFDEAAIALEQALQTLPAEGWIRDQLITVRFASLTNGEIFRDGIGPRSYQIWIDDHEPHLPSWRIAPAIPFWLLEPQVDGSLCWHLLSGSINSHPEKSHLGDLPWPTDGWLVLLGEGAQLRKGAIQAVESWLACGLKEQQSLHLLSQSTPFSTLQWRQPDLIYTDEDILDDQGMRINPWLKSDWLEESFWSSPWLSSLSIWRMSWLRDQQLPLPPADLEGRWRWLLLALERKPQIAHVPLILVHSSSNHQLSPGPLKRYLESQGESIESVRPHRTLHSCFELKWYLPGHWSCSIIIPTRDRADLLEKCLHSLWWSTADARSAGLELEILIVDNQSIEPATFDLFREWETRIKVLRCDEPFNWSRLNNLAAVHAKGQLLLFLNNDIQAIKPDWIEAMAAQALRPLVGAVGAVLLYPNGSIQHAGVVVGMHGGADHAYRHSRPGNYVHRGRSSLLTRWGAVTGACLMVRKDLFERIGGFDQGLPVEFNDVDICIRMTQLGYRCVIPPEAVLVHHESQSRDAHDSQTARQALIRLQQRWPLQLESVQPWWPRQCEANRSDGRLLGFDKIIQENLEI